MRCLYIIYWGLTEPIGQSGTLPTVLELARTHSEQIVLLTFDKPAHKADPNLVARTREVLEEAGIEWIDLGYTKYPPNLSTAWDIVKGVAAGVALVLTRGVDVVHGRTYVGALIGRAISALTRRPFVVHPDGFWPDERVDDGVWREGSPAYRLARVLERGVYRSATLVIALTEGAKARILDEVSRDPATVLVVPTSVDVDRFGRSEGAPLPGGGLRALYLGSVGGRYQTDELMRFFKVVRDEHPGNRCSLVTRAPRALIEDSLRRTGIPSTTFELSSVDPVEVPGTIAASSFGVFMLRPGRSGVATSATKVGEYLAGGIPVVLSEGCGDLPALIRASRTGVVLADHSARAYESAIRELRALLDDPTLSARCAATARENMSVGVCASAQAECHKMAVTRFPR